MTNYISRAELKKYLGINNTDDDAVLDTCIATAQQKIDNYCGRKFSLDSTATERRYNFQDHRYMLVDDIGSTTGLVIKTDTNNDGTFATTWTSSDYQLEPYQSATPVNPQYAIRAVGSLLFPYNPYGRHSVSVTAKWGFPSVPSPITTATFLLAARYFKRKDSPDGLVTYPDFGVVRVGRMDPDVAALLSSYRVPYVRDWR